VDFEQIIAKHKTKDRFIRTIIKPPYLHHEIDR